MSKFGSMNNFQLTREAYDMKKRLELTEENMNKVEKRTKDIAEIIIDNNALNIKEFIQSVNKSVDIIKLKKQINLLEQKMEKKTIYPIQISNEEKEELNKFLNENELSNFYSSLIKLGVRKIDDILFLTEEDLLLEGFSIISARKCLEYAKLKAETIVI